MATKSAPYHHGDLKAALLDESMRLLAEDGLTGFSVAKVAKRLGVSSASPYRHFAGKEALLAEIAGRIADQLTGRLAEAVAAQTDPAERLVRAVGSYTGYLLEHRAGVEVMFQPGLNAAQYRATHERTRKFWDLFIDLAMRATPNGGYAEVFVLLDQVIAVAHGYATLHHHRLYSAALRLPQEVQVRAENTVRSLIGGDAAPSIALADDAESNGG